MDIATQETILNAAVAELPFTPAFRQFAGEQGWRTLADIQQHRTGDLLKLPGFTEQLLYEYVDLMETKGFGGLVDP